MSIGNVAQYLTEVGVVLRSAHSQAETGAIVNVWTSESEVEGRLRPFVAYRWGSELVSADKVTSVSNFRWYCAVASDIRVDDRLRVGSEVYRVVFVADVMSMGRLKQVDLKLVGHDG